MNHEKILQEILASPLNQPGKLFDCYSVEKLLKEKTGEQPDTYPISIGIPVLVAQGKLIQVRNNGTFYGWGNPVVRLVQPHENVREKEMRRLASMIANPPPTQMQLL